MGSRNKSAGKPIAASVGFIGAGTIAQVIIAGMLRTRVISPQKIYVANRTGEKLAKLKKQYRIRPVKDNVEAVKAARIILLCVKPQDLRIACEEIKNVLTSKHVLISLAAGVTMSSLRKICGNKPRLIRAMPNTPASVGLGATGLYADGEASSGDLKLAQKIFASVGIVRTVSEENLMDAVTALSGSGPAYVFYLIEAMTEAAVQTGLPEKDAKSLVVQTILGAAHLVRESGMTPGELRRRVSSPGGTTLEGIKALEEGLFTQTIQNAIRAAQRRAREMALAFE